MRMHRAAFGQIFEKLLSAQRISKLFASSNLAAKYCSCKLIRYPMHHLLPSSIYPMEFLEGDGELSQCQRIEHCGKFTYFPWSKCNLIPYGPSTYNHLVELN